MDEIVQVDSKKFGEVSNTGDYEGAYIGDMKQAVIAGLLSSTNVLLIGEPGCGKSDISIGIAEMVYGEDSFILHSTPDTERDEIEGPVMYKEMHDKGIVVRNHEGMVYDDTKRVIVVDEFSRLPGPSLENLMHPLNGRHVSKKYRAVFIANANFVSQDKRVEAVYDRFNVLYKAPVVVVDEKSAFKKIMGAYGVKKSMGGGIPDRETIDAVQTMPITSRASDAIASFLTEFAKTVADGLRGENGELLQEFKVNFRRRNAWANMLTRMSIYYSGTGDFADIPAQAKACLRWCYVSQNSAELENWAKFTAAGSVDPVDALVQQLFQSTATRLTEIYNSEPNKQMVVSGEFGRFAMESVGKLTQVMEDSGIPKDSVAEDPRFVQFRDEIRKAFAKVAQGQPPF